MGINKEAFQLCAVYKNLYFFATSHMKIRINTTSHTRIHIRYFKSHVLHLNVCNEIECSYDKIIITIVCIN